MILVFYLVPIYNSFKLVIGYYILLRQRICSICIFVSHNHKNNIVRNKYVLCFHNASLEIIFCIFWVYWYENILHGVQIFRLGSEHFQSLSFWRNLDTYYIIKRRSNFYDSHIWYSTVPNIKMSKDKQSFSGWLKSYLSEFGVFDWRSKKT
jgi:hypothetical protein